MPVTTTAVRINGLREFQAKIRAADRMLPRQLRVVFNDAATLIVQGAKPLVPRRTGRAAGSLAAMSTQREGRVRGGGGGAPYYPWLDFGGHVGRRASVSRAVMKPDGRYIYPTFRNRRGQVLEAMDDGLTTLIRRVGL